MESSLIFCHANTAALKHAAVLNSDVAVTTKDENNTSDLTCVALFPSKLAGSILPERHWGRGKKEMTAAGGGEKSWYDVVCGVLLGA